MQFKITLGTARKVYRNFGEWVSNQPEHLTSALGSQKTRPDEAALMDRHIISPGRSVDLGCGPGRIFDYLLEKQQKVAGVDISSALLKTAVKYEGRVQLYQADISNEKTLSPEIGQFDNLISLGCPPGGFFTEAEQIGFARVCRRLAAPKARLFIDTLTHSRSVPTVEFDLFGVQQKTIKRGSGLLWWHRIGALCAHYYPSREEIVNLAKLAGFDRLIESLRFANTDLFVFGKED